MRFVFFILLLCFSKSFAHEFEVFKKKNETVYMTSGMWGNLFDEEGNGFYGLGNIVQSQGYKIKQAHSVKKLKDVKKLIFFEIEPQYIKHFSRYPSHRLVLFLWEPPSVLPRNYDKKNHTHFGKIFTWDDDLVDNIKYFKLAYPIACKAHFRMNENLPKFNDRKLCCMIVRNKTSIHPDELYSERLHAARFFEKRNNEQFNLMGMGFEKMGFETYLGPVPCKSCMKNYKFSICYENMTNIKGYVSEKIFDSFINGCVPIYLGATNIEAYVPKNCFIDKRDFSAYEDLYEYLVSMDEETYDKYLENIRNFLKSDMVDLFSIEHFQKTFENALEF